MNSAHAYISEIYSAIQGEGPLVGVRQIFIRFSICDLRCVWCDTPNSLEKNDFCFVEKASGLREYEKIKNPISANSLINYLKSLDLSNHHSISLTGGEPLIHSKFISAFIQELKSTSNIPLYLETGGHKPNELREIVDLLDYTSMDIKLPSSAKAGNLWDKHNEFLSILLTKKNQTWVKIVITADTDFDELLRAVNTVKVLTEKHNKNIEVFLQPVSEINNIKPSAEVDLLMIHSKLLAVYPHIRVVPQVHKLIGQR